MIVGEGFYKKLALFLFILSVGLLTFIIGLVFGQKNPSFDGQEKNVLSEKSTVEDKDSRPVGFVHDDQTPDKDFEGSKYLVTKIIDGDTIVVSINGKDETVRIIGVDTPETVDPRKGVHCFGEEASNKAKELLFGKSVALEEDPSQGERDKYKRLLRHVFVDDLENFGLLMISEGFAHEYTYDLPYKYQAEFKVAEKNARENNLGLWNPKACDSSLKPTQTSNDPGSLKSTGTYECNCQKLCGQISTCDEAYYQLESCGCTARDSDGDGVPCEKICR